MEINLTINTESKSIDVLYNGYNIIKTTIYNDEATKNIYKILKESINTENLANIETEKDFEKYLKLED